MGQVGKRMLDSEKVVTQALAEAKEAVNQMEVTTNRMKNIVQTEYDPNLFRARMRKHANSIRFVCALVCLLVVTNLVLGVLLYRHSTDMDQTEMSLTEQLAKLTQKMETLNSKIEGATLPAKR